MSDIERFQQQLDRLRTEIGRVLVGQSTVVERVLTCLVADGHVLLEGVPGLGKTLLVRTLATCLGLDYRRIQFTPDLMPADIVGTHLLEEVKGGGRELRFQQGPVFTQVLLADEINRATPKTQSALLEAMQERQVTIAGQRRPLPDPFFVMATQNPLEMEGTYPLPEAQLDRFFFKVAVPFPTLEELMEVMDRTTGTKRPEVSSVTTLGDLTDMRRIVREVEIVPEVVRYAMRLVAGTQPGHELAAPVAKLLRYGASPRGAQTLVLGAKVQALLQGRSHASFADVRSIAAPALRHRLGRTFEAEAEGLSSDDLITRLLSEVPELEGRAAKELSPT
ncbi:MAG: MoxR family ATPase [Myxococcota bacterium]